MNKLFERLLKLVVISTFIYCLLAEQHYYSIFLRSLVFASSLYFAYNSRQIVGIYGIRLASILFGVFAILFNPFKEFGFNEMTWRIIDAIVCVLIAFTLDWKTYIKSLPQKEKLIFNLIRNCFGGVAALIAAFWLFPSAIRVNPYDEYLLITKAKIANGFIINVREYEGVVYVPESQGGGTEASTDYFYKYYFTTEDGKKINDGSSELVDVPEFKGNPIPIQVEYIPDNPKINRVKEMTNQCKTISEFIWQRIVIGGLLLLFLLSFGFILIRNAIKKYLMERNQVNTNF